MIKCEQFYYKRKGMENEKNFQIYDIYMFNHVSCFGSFVGYGWL